MRTKIRNVIDDPTNGSLLYMQPLQTGLRNEPIDRLWGRNRERWCLVQLGWSSYLLFHWFISPFSAWRITHWISVCQVRWVFINLSNYITYFILFYRSQHWSANFGCWHMKGSTICQLGGLKAVKWESNWSSCWKVTFLLLHSNTVFLIIWVRYGLLLGYIYKSIDLSLTRLT